MKRAIYIEHLTVTDIPTNYKKIIVFDAHNTLIDETNSYLLKDSAQFMLLDL